MQFANMVRGTNGWKCLVYFIFAVGCLAREHAPTRPSNLTATAVSTTQINLSWTASSDRGNVSISYLVERCQGTGCTNFAQVATSVTVTYNDTGLTPSTSYTYIVRAIDSAGSLSPFSNVATANTLGPTPTPPTPPTNLAATTISPSQINLSWTASTDNVGVTGYFVERCQGAGCANFNQIATSATTSYNDSGLTSSTSYSYRVRATDAAGNLSLYSNVASATTLAATVGTLSASPTSINFGNVAFGNSSTAPVVLSNTGSASVTISQANVSGSAFSTSGLSVPFTLAAGQNGTFNVTFTPGTYGPMTGNVSIVSNATNSPLNEPLSGTGSHTVDLSWQAASTSTVAGYNVYRGVAAGGPYTKLNSSLVTGTSYIDSAVQAGQTYYYVATALDANNNESAYSNQATAVVPSP